MGEDKDSRNGRGGVKHCTCSGRERNQEKGEGKKEETDTQDFPGTRRGKSQGPE